MVVPAVDENLSVVLDRVSENPQWTSLELLLLLLLPLLGGHLLLASHFDCNSVLFCGCEIFLINTNVWLSFTLSNGARPGEFQ